MADEFLFVYGTLRRDCGHQMHDAMLKYCHFYSMASMAGQLYEVNGYPGAIMTDDGSRVVGELYRIVAPDNLFALLDDYEECSPHYAKPHEFCRLKIATSMQTMQSVMAWCYLYKASTGHLRRIITGNYRDYLA
ncbi:MAG: gamma-glutamylcyclotransferase family protein [Methylococcaceae bacterium]|jgi:gamma-glutamylcyclotransferase (GGCT)/AIG2-like uncharacterized protein YtfP